LSASEHTKLPSYSLIEWIVERLPDAIHRKRGSAFNYLLAAALMGGALMVRMEIAPIGVELRYVTFFPAVTLAAVIGGFWPGLFASAIGMCLVTYIFTPPYYSISAETLRASLWPNMVFLMNAVIVCASIEAMHRYRARYASERETQDLYNRAPCGYHSLDKDGILRQINQTELAWLGYTRDEVVGKMKWPDLLAPASHQIFHESFPQFMKQGFVRNLEIEMMRKDGTILVGLVNATAIYDADGDFVMSRSSVVDISKRRRAENELRWQQSFMRQIIDTDPSHIFVKDEKGGFLLVNQSLASSYGLTPAEMVGKNNTEIVPLSAESFGYMATDDQVIRDGGEITLVEPFTLKNGERRWFLTTKKRLSMPDGGYHVLGIAVDITCQRLAEINLAESYKELQRLSVHLEMVRADERARIALNLHDEMGAILAALNMRVAWLASKLPAELPQLLAETKEIKELVAGGIRTMHQIVNQLRSDLLGEAGLSAAIRDYVKKFQEHTKITCNLVLPKEEFNLDSDQALAVFRILQEALNNVVKHSRASTVSIHFMEQDELLLMEVADNGVGFDPSAQKEKSIGLLGIRERALLIGGRARIISTPGDGAAVWVSIPHAHKSYELA
jgi:PAS domain S-box-containing protein